MGFQFNGTQANVTLSGASGIPIPNTAQTVINVYSACNGSNLNVYTVPAGKTFYLMGFSGITGAAGSYNIYKNDGTTYLIQLNTFAAGNSQQWISSPCPIWAYAATENVVIKGTAGSTCNVWGILQ